MLPVVAPMKNVAAQMWFHTIAMVITSYFVVTTAALPNWILILTGILGLGFIWLMTKLKGDKAEIDKAAAAIFHGSITYLSGFSVLLVIGALVI